MRLVVSIAAASSVRTGGATAESRAPLPIVRRKSRCPASSVSAGLSCHPFGCSAEIAAVAAGDVVGSSLKRRSAEVA